jgi:uncharacterized alkaline shock family protein YloU
MSEKKPERMHQLDPQEFELPETTYSHEIENRVFRGIILNILSQTPGISPLEGTFLETFIGRVDTVKGITIDQDTKTHSVNIVIEISIQYGVNIPKKAEEIQSRVSQAITEMTGMRVASVHVVFRELIREQKEPISSTKRPIEVEEPFSSGIEHEFS